MTDHLVKQQPEGLRGPFVAAMITAAIVIGLFAVLVSGILLAGWAGRIAGPAPLPQYPVAKTVAGIHQTNVRGAPDGLVRQAAELKALTEYRYVDPQRKVAQIPVERAMDWLVEDARSGALPAPDPGSVTAADLERSDGSR